MATSHYASNDIEHKVWVHYNYNVITISSYAMPADGSIQSSKSQI